MPARYVLRVEVHDVENGPYHFEATHERPWLLIEALGWLASLFKLQGIEGALAFLYRKAARLSAANQIDVSKPSDVH